MVLTQRKTTSPRDPNQFPATQLCLLGKYLNGMLQVFRLDYHLPSPAVSRIYHSANTSVRTALVRVAEPIALTSIFPYAWQLVLDFGGDRANASFYAGLLISAFAAAEAVTGM